MLLVVSFFMGLFTKLNVPQHKHLEVVIASGASGNYIIVCVAIYNWVACNDLCSCVGLQYLTKIFEIPLRFPNNSITGCLVAWI